LKLIEVKWVVDKVSAFVCSIFHVSGQSVVDLLFSRADFSKTKEAWSDWMSLADENYRKSKVARRNAIEGQALKILDSALDTE